MLNKFACLSSLAVWGVPVALCLAAASTETRAGQSAVNLPVVTVYSPRVANQSPVATFAMPVSALRYEPRLDLQGRNSAEGQADLTLRGGIFENTGLQLGAVSLGDPQTGHYLAEVPVAPVMLSVPQIVTGADLTLGAANATVGALSYGWRPIQRAGFATLASGDNNLRRAEFYQGVTNGAGSSGRRVGFDVAVAQSKSDGAVPFGDHNFSRANLRLQYVASEAQTDIFLGYQGKRFGWPNLYTPFGSNETENLQTRLVQLNHRRTWVGSDFLEVGVFDRRNKDDYAFDRFARLGAVHPFQHRTSLRGGALQARRQWEALTLDLRGEFQSDRLQSTSLIWGRYQSRRVLKLASVVGRRWSAVRGGEYLARFGGSWDDTNRDAGLMSPAVELARTFRTSGVSRVHVGFARSSQMPTYTALNSSTTSGIFRGNPNLGRATSDTFEFGVEGGVAGWTLQSEVFLRRDLRLVDWTFQRGVIARTANAVDLEVAGLELVARRSWTQYDLVLGYTALGKSEDFRGATVDASFYALNYARHRATAALTIRPARGMELRIDNSLRWQAPNSLRTVGGRRAIHTLLGISYRPPGIRGVEVSLAIDNLWNELFQEIPAVPAAPRQVSVAVGYAW